MANLRENYAIYIDNSINNLSFRVMTPLLSFLDILRSAFCAFSLYSYVQ